MSAWWLLPAFLVGLWIGAAVTFEFLEGAREFFGAIDCFFGRLDRAMRKRRNDADCIDAEFKMVERGTLEDKSKR